MHLIQIALLAVIQGLAELLPVSSSAHVIVAEKLMGLDPTAPEMTLLLVMLHTGTMFAVIVYFWGGWRRNYFQTRERAVAFGKQVLLATLTTGFFGFFLMLVVEKVVMRGAAKAEVEMLFGNLKLVSAGLAWAGLLILLSAFLTGSKDRDGKLGSRESIWIGFVQAFCLPIRGFSRSGATISTGLILGLAKAKAEEFSFALAVALTPAVLLREVHRLMKAPAVGTLSHPFLTSLVGMAFSFAAGLLALRWLSSWLQRGRWMFFGFYCLVFALLVFLLS